MRTVAVEEHFATEDFLNHLRAMLSGTYPHLEVIAAEPRLADEVLFLAPPAGSPATDKFLDQLDKLLDCGEGRVRQMDAAGIDVQVLSLVSPGVQVLDPPTAIAVARRVNEALAQAVKAHPDRFVGLAAIPPQSPNDAADELERAVRELGLRGTSINSHVRGEYLDDQKYWPIFERAEKLGVPIYLHPRAPLPDMFQPYYEPYPVLATAMLGFGAEVSLHAVRLICGGVFDRYPGVKIVIEHLGEAFPFWLWRIENHWNKSLLLKKQEKVPSQYFKDNVFASTSGNFSVPSFQCAHAVLGADNILFAVDYPLESNREGVRFLESLPITEEDKEKISHLNAEKLFGLQ